ncbi:MAG: AmmeMemoRadiSam system protein B [Thermodesulfobacteriota bacterium]
MPVSISAIRHPCLPDRWRLFVFVLKALLWASVMFSLLAGAPLQAADAPERIRESVIAGSWYPADPVILRGKIEGFLRQAVLEPFDGKPVALIAPHAGYQYSGQVAAHAYRLLQSQKFKTVIVVAPSHYARFRGVSVYDQGGYRTPLGTVPLDRELIAELKRKDPSIRYVAEAHQKEHALEIQLPFLQVVLPNFKLVPLIMGDQDLSVCRKLAETLADLARNKPVLMAASTDLSHFHSYAEAQKLDNRVADHVRRMDVEGLASDLAGGRCEACGGGPLLAVLTAARLLGADQCEVLKALNSGDVTGDRSRVVGYMAAACRQQGAKTRTGIPPSLTSKEKNLLHQIARQSVEAVSNGLNNVTLPQLPPRLQEPAGAFVTLRKHKQLRGCIGHISGIYPLAETVARMAQAAAREDPRFPPVRKEELPELEFEISVLSPLQSVSDIDSIQVGVHGIYMKQGARSGLLLPQVPGEYGWDRITFLEQTCRKANLDKDAWKDPQTHIFIFSAEVF